MQASNLAEALDVFNEGMKGTMADYDVTAINETPIMDVYKVKLAGEKSE